MTTAAGDDTAAPAQRLGTDHDPALLAELLARQSVRTVYQPVVELYTGVVVGYEALSRGPQGSALEQPDQLFAAARRSQQLAELDGHCQSAALAGAHGAGLLAPWTLFINVEPDASAPRPLPLPSSGPAGAGRPMRVIVELTERALTDRPADLLRRVAAFRTAGWGIALDDVGADPASLALLPLLRPDVIKLDLRLVQDKPDARIAQIVNAVNAEAERSGAVVLAEGIETEAHLAIAKSLGATLGQGWLLGRPGPLPVSTRPASGRQVPAAVPIASHPVMPDGASPFELVAGSRAVRQATKSLLLEVSRHLERQALSSSDSAVVLATFQNADHLTTATVQRYAELAAKAAFVGVFGADIPATPAPGVRGADLAEGDVVLSEWDVAVVGPHFAGALVSRDLGDDGPELDRRFDYILTHDRTLAVHVAGSLMTRMHAEGGAARAGQT
ncbi:MAG: EAL domain-containing protein [Nocardioidaceae bacterium]|nr:EAL domain-containing protein [Nocardioidaceae bacterium]